MKLEVEPIRTRLRAPFASSAGTIEARELLLVRLEHADGHVGFGEAAPLPSYDGVTVADVQVALEDCREVLGRGERLEREQLLAECARLAVLPQAISAIDLALWDLAGRRAGEPVWRLLGATGAPAVEVNYTVGSADRAGAAAEAGLARAGGFRCLKVKAGVGDDAGRLAAVRAAAGPEMAIRLDANGAWSHQEAVASLAALAPVGIELCEEPVRGRDQIARLSASVSMPLSIDETSVEPGALEERLCDAVCLKLTRWGGISGTLDAARRARAARYEVYFSSTIDGPLGIAAALHAAAMVRPDRPSGLATLSLFDREHPLAPSDGRIPVPDGPGLGIEPLGWYW